MENTNGGLGELQQDPASAPSVTITAPDGRVKTLVPSKRQQQRTVRIMSTVLSIEFLLCLLMIALETVVLSVLNPQSLSRPHYTPVSSTESYHYYVRTCRIGSGIWSGLIGLVSIGVGIGFIMARVHCCHICTGRVGTLKVVYGATAFLCAIVDAILVASVGMCVYGLVRAVRAAERKKAGDEVVSMFNMALAADSALIGVAAFHIIVTIASIKVLQRGWSDESYRIQNQEKPQLHIVIDEPEDQGEKVMPKRSVQVERDRNFHVQLGNR